MTLTKSGIVKIAAVSALVPLLGSVSFHSSALDGVFSMAAMAQTGGSGQGGNSDNGNRGSGEGNQSDGSRGGGQPDNAGSGSGNQGGTGMDNRPNWGGAELTDIGRLNILRADDRVLTNAMYNTNLEFDDYSFYEMTVQGFIDSLTSLDQIIDSPVTNMGMLELYWSTGDFAFTQVVRTADGGTEVVSVDLGIDPNSAADFSAIAIGIAIDKETVPSVGIVEAMATIVWGPEEFWPSWFDAEDIAEDAALVQVQVVDIHDNQ